MDNTFAALYELQLGKLKDEVNNFKDEANLWKKADGITNTAGNLVLHLLGNLNLCIGTNIGHTGYVRNRELEFSATGVTRAELVDSIESLTDVIKISLENISDERLNEQYVLEMHGQHSTRFYLGYFYGHLNYHLGQINYLRRILEA
jgi:hypothetical protein